VKTHVEERGVNILFIAVGMLHRYEDESSAPETEGTASSYSGRTRAYVAPEKFTMRIDGTGQVAALVGRERLL
jgi:hypothetical protein